LKLSIQKRLKEAISLCEKNKIQEGLKIIESILKEFPDNKEVKEGSNFCKVSWKTEISSQDRKKIEQIYYMAVDSYLKGKYKEAQKYIDEIYKIDPLNENAKKLEEKLKNIGTKE
jgi:tetratricopeptide (TPR) repeat protein